MIDTILHLLIFFLTIGGAVFILMIAIAFDMSNTSVNIVSTFRNEKENNVKK